MRHAVAGQEWPPGTTLAEYIQSIRDIALDPASGLFVSQFRTFGWHHAIVGRADRWRGPRGYTWAMVEYRVTPGYWMTAFQMSQGLAYFSAATRKAGQWLRQPN